MTKLTNKNIRRAYVLVGFGDRATAVSFSGFYRINLEQRVMIPRDSTSIPSDAVSVAYTGIGPCSVSCRCVDLLVQGGRH
jgi:hypothetical protein